MKKIIAILLAVVMCFGIFAACGDEEESGTGAKKDQSAAADYKEFEKAMEKTQELDSLSAKMDMDITVSTEGMTMEVPMDMIIKVKNAKSEEPIAYVDLSMTIMGVKVTMEMYQEDGWGYYVSNGEKYKVNLKESSEIADYTQNLEGLMQELPEKIMKKASVESNDDGSKTLTVTLGEDDFQEYFGGLMSDLGYGTEGASIKKATVSMTAKDGYLTVYEMNMEMEMTTEGVVTQGKAKISATYDDPGEEVIITAPEGYKSFEEVSYDEVE